MQIGEVYTRSDKREVAPLVPLNPFSVTYLMPYVVAGQMRMAWNEV